MQHDLNKFLQKNRAHPTPTPSPFLAICEKKMYNEEKFYWYVIADKVYAVLVEFIFI